MRMLKVLAFFWITFCTTYYWAINSFPLNFNEYPHIMTSWESVIFMSGVLFGVDLILFYTAFQVMYDKLHAIYLRGMRFNVFWYLAKTYLHHLIPVCAIMAGMMCVYPFLGNETPLFAYFTSSYFLNNCTNNWWPNLLFIQNFYPWNPSEACGPHLILIATEI
jgi:hypothetical protein